MISFIASTWRFWAVFLAGLIACVALTAWFPEPRYVAVKREAPAASAELCDAYAAWERASGREVESMRRLCAQRDR